MVKVLRSFSAYEKTIPYPLILEVFQALSYETERNLSHDYGEDT